MALFSQGREKERRLDNIREAKTRLYNGTKLHRRVEKVAYMAGEDEEIGLLNDKTVLDIWLSHSSNQLWPG